MSAIVMDGKAVAAKVRAEVAIRAKEFAAKFGRRPGLAVVQVGQDPVVICGIGNKNIEGLLQDGKKIFVFLVFRHQGRW